MMVRSVTLWEGHILNIWGKIFKNGPSKIFKRLTSTNFTRSIPEYFASYVCQNGYLVYGYSFKPFILTCLISDNILNENVLLSKKNTNVDLPDPVI